MKLGCITISLVGAIYLALFIISWMSTPQEHQNLYGDTAETLKKMEIVRIIVLAVLGGNEIFNANGNFGSRIKE